MILAKWIMWKLCLTDLQMILKTLKFNTKMPNSSFYFHFSNCFRSIMVRFVKNLLSLPSITDNPNLITWKTKI